VAATSEPAVGEADALVEDDFAEATFAVDTGAGAAEADVDVDSDAGGRRPSSPRAKADDPKNTNSMAATAILTALLPTRTQNECSTIE